MPSLFLFHPLPVRRAVLALTCLCGGTGVLAQPTAPPPTRLAPVVITGNPLRAPETIAPSAVLTGSELLLRAEPTLGGTLDGTPGIAATGFGPNASRPIIRGLDGDRIRILNNSGASVDASSLSFDHAVPTDISVLERIEVLRGPAALLYGGTAMGGVVNLIDNRIPRQPVTRPQGRVEISGASGNGEGGGAFVIEGGGAGFALHADAFARRTGDVRVPVALACTQNGNAVVRQRICNSASSARGGAAGASAFFDRGRLGLSVSSDAREYGVVAEDEVTIDMKQERIALEGQWRPRTGWIEEINLQASSTDYRHSELEAGAVGTVFKTRGSDLRLEARHAPVAGWQGVLGLQAERSRFSADGQEAFAPYSRTREQALFVHEELATGWGRLSAGARVESVRVRSEGNPRLDRFAVGERSFRPASYAVGALWKLAPAWQLSANLARSERAPRDYELFANGPHVATGAYEVGDTQLRKERGTQAELGLAFAAAGHSASVSAFVYRFRDFISLESTGRDLEVEEGETLPEFAYRAVPARFRGVEAQGRSPLVASAATGAPPLLALEWRADAVRATNTATGQPLPRIAPLRAGLTLVAQQGPWSARLGADHSARQSRVARGERPTPAYTLWNAALAWRQKAPAADLLWYARLSNASDRLAYSATSILTQTAPGRSPLAGRSLRVGVQVQF